MLRKLSLALTLLIFLSSLCCSGLTGAEPDGWPNWRGPLGNGTALGDSFPVQWSADANVSWTYSLAGRGASTPIVAAGHLFVTSNNEQSNFLEALTLDGKLAWKKEVGKPRAGKHKKATGSNSSPVTDGKLIYAYFKSGDLVCCQIDGKVVWQMNLQEKYGEDTLWWDLGTSPVLTDRALVIAVMQSGPSYLLALDRATGRELWKADRVLPAPNEANQSYSTPIVTTVQDKQVLLTLGADHLTCHAASNGELLWKVGGFNPSQQQFFRSIASPVMAGNLVICPYARGGTVTAIDTTATSDNQRVVWTRTDLGSDVPTPTISHDRLYVIGDRGDLWCLDPTTGKNIWKDQLPKSRVPYSSSPVVAGGHVYVTREDATTFVVKNADSYELVATNELNDGTVATPVAVGGKIYLRTYDKLFCFGK